MNTFNQLHLEAISKIIPASHKVARSSVYTTAVVIGTPGKPGALMISFLEVCYNADQPGWFWSRFVDTDPKSVADDRLGSIDKNYTETGEVYHWTDLVKVIQEFTSS